MICLALNLAVAAAAPMFLYLASKVMVGQGSGR